MDVGMKMRLGAQAGLAAATRLPVASEQRLLPHSAAQLSSACCSALTRLSARLLRSCLPCICQSPPLTAP